MAAEQTPIGWAILPLKKYAQFSGRSTRAEYWWFTLAYVVTGFLVDAIDMAIGSEAGVLGWIYSVGLMVPMIAVTVRRLHDIDRSGWWLLVVLAPVVFFGYQTTYSVLERTYGESQPTTSAVLAISALVVACVVLT